MISNWSDISKKV